MTAKVNDLMRKLNDWEVNEVFVMVEMETDGVKNGFGCVPVIEISSKHIKVYGNEEAYVEFCIDNICSIHYIEDIEEMYVVDLGITKITFCI